MTLNGLVHPARGFRNIPFISSAFRKSDQSMTVIAQKTTCIQRLYILYLTSWGNVEGALQDPCPMVMRGQPIMNLNISIYF